MSFKYIACWAAFDDLSRIEHRDPITSLTGKGQIVQHKHTTCATFTGQLQDQSDNLCLNRDIQSRSRLVSQKQIRTTCQCDSNHDPLLHAS